MIIAKFYLVVLVGYLLGSIPIGSIISRRFGKQDLIKQGSGKTGATNALRIMGRKAFLLVAGLDIFKGVLAVLFAGLIVGQDYLLVGESYGVGILFAEVLGGLAAMAGHIWPLFNRLKGGRGVATFFGGLIALCPAAALFGGEILIIGAGFSGFASIGSITGAVGTYAILVPLTIIYGFPAEYLIYTLIGTIVILYMHRDNIKRLISGKERRIGEKA